MPVRKHIRQRAYVGFTDTIITKDGVFTRDAYAYEKAETGSVQVLTFTSASGQESRWLIMYMAQEPYWFGASRDFFFSQKSAQRAVTLAGLKSDIQKFVDKKTTNYDQNLFKDKNDEYWLIAQYDGIVTDTTYALTGAYDGVALWGGEMVSASNKEKDIQKAINIWVDKFATGPVDPTKSLYGYNVGHYSVFEGPPTAEGKFAAAPPSSKDTTPATTPDSKKSASKDAAGKPAASPWQIPADAGADADQTDDFAPAPKKKTDIPWTPIVLGGGALVAVAYLMKKS